MTVIERICDVVPFVYGFVNIFIHVQFVLPVHASVRCFFPPCKQNVSTLLLTKFVINSDVKSNI